MSDHDRSKDGLQPVGGFWRSRAGIALIVFLAVAGLLLAYEHRVHVLTGTGALVVFLAICVGMHLFMHGGHGDHGSHGGRDEDPGRKDRR